MSRVRVNLILPQCRGSLFNNCKYCQKFSLNPETCKKCQVATGRCSADSIASGPSFVFAFYKVVGNNTSSKGRENGILGV